MIFAAENGHENIVNLLLKYPSVDINAKTKSGCTAMVLASLNGHLNVVNLLIEYSDNNEKDIALGSISYKCNYDDLPFNLEFNTFSSHLFKKEKDNYTKIALLLIDKGADKKILCRIINRKIIDDRVFFKRHFY